MITKNYWYVLIGLFLMSITVITCDKSDEGKILTISLDKTTAEARIGENVSATATIAADAGISNLKITKYLDSDEQKATTVQGGDITDGKYTFTDTIEEEDINGVLKYNFAVTDNDGNTAQRELVVYVELSIPQILVKYDWALTDMIRHKTGASDIAEVDTDDIYRFNEDKTFQMDFGEKESGWEAFKTFCYWKVDEDILIESRLDLQSDWSTWLYNADTLEIETITESKIEATIIIRGLNEFDPTYEPIEPYTKVYSATPKSSNFKPHIGGGEENCSPLD